MFLLRQSIANRLDPVGEDADEFVRRQQRLDTRPDAGQKRLKCGSSEGRKDSGRLTWRESRATTGRTAAASGRSHRTDSPSRNGSHFEMMLEQACGIRQARQHVVARERGIARQHVVDAVAGGKKLQHGAGCDARAFDDRPAVADVRIDDDLLHVTIVASGTSGR